MDMKRRQFLQIGAVAFGAGVLPGLNGLARAQASGGVLKFVPQADLAVIDPHGSPAYVTRNHASLVFDTLYGVDGNNVPQPQMVEGHVVSEDGKVWTMTLREGLMFHDGSPVQARDAVASVKRWAKRDGFAQALTAALEDLSAPDERTIVFRLSRPLPILPDMLGKMAAYWPAILPERLALTDPFQPLSEIIGSGPYRYVGAERIPGALNVYERFEGYVPRPEPADNLAGGKVAHFDRVEWHTMPDPATAAAALLAGEVDWWEQPTADLAPIFEGTDVTVASKDPGGNIGILRMNFRQKPFDNPAIRRVVLKAVNQRDYMLAAVGEDTRLWSVPQGYFHPKSMLASTEGLETFTAEKDFAALKAELIAAGYQGERIVLLSTADYPVINAFGEVCADMMRRIGMNVDLVVQDWATIAQRMANKESLDQGGYSAYCNFVAGAGTFNTAAHTFLRSNGDGAYYGWPDIPEIEALRAAWLDAATPAEQAEIGRKIQEIALDQVPFVPLGLFYFPTAFRSDLEGMLDTYPVFWNIRRS